MITRIQILAIILAAPALRAQWLNYPTAGVPRLPNGQPNLSAPAPRTPEGKPDLSGLWEPATPAAVNGSSTFLTGDLPGDRQFSGIGVNVPGCVNSNVVPRASPTARPSKAPWARCNLSGVMSLSSIAA